MSETVLGDEFLVSQHFRLTQADESVSEQVWVTPVVVLPFQFVEVGDNLNFMGDGDIKTLHIECPRRVRGFTQFGLPNPEGKVDKVKFPFFEGGVVHRW